jgi:hypothetical protein
MASAITRPEVYSGFHIRRIRENPWLLLFQSRSFDLDGLRYGCDGLQFHTIYSFNVQLGMFVNNTDESYLDTLPELIPSMRSVT